VREAAERLPDESAETEALEDTEPLREAEDLELEAAPEEVEA
jgi:hypothetical protein